jgi:hypothetical protein
MTGEYLYAAFLFSVRVVASFSLIVAAVEYPCCSQKGKKRRPDRYRNCPCIR